MSQIVGIVGDNPSDCFLLNRLGRLLYRGME